MLSPGGLLGKFDCWLRATGIWFNGAARNDILDSGLLLVEVDHSHAYLLIESQMLTLRGGQPIVFSESNIRKSDRLRP